MKISVVIPLYNKKGTILRALQSVFYQNIAPEEIIVVNDGSDDGSERIVAELNMSVIKLFHQLNGGVSLARNRGIEEAKGEWIAFLDADDEWMPDYLSIIKSLALMYPNCSVLATSYKECIREGFTKDITLKNIPFRGVQGILNNYFQVAASSSPPIWSSAVVIKKDALVSVGGFPVGVRSGEDLLTWAKLASKFEIAYSIIPSSIFYLNKFQELDRISKTHEYKIDKVGNELIKLHETSSVKTKKDLARYISHWYKMKVAGFLRVGNLKGVRYFSLKSMRYNIFNYKIYIYLLLSFLPRAAQQLILKKYK